MMTGTSKRGPFETAADKKVNLIKAWKQLNKEMETASNRTAQAITYKMTGIERQLLDLGMTGQEIETALFS